MNQIETLMSMYPSIEQSRDNFERLAVASMRDAGLFNRAGPVNEKNILIRKGTAYLNQEMSAIWFGWCLRVAVVAQAEKEG